MNHRGLLASVPELQEGCNGSVLPCKVSMIIILCSQSHLGSLVWGEQCQELEASYQG